MSVRHRLSCFVFLIPLLACAQSEWIVRSSGTTEHLWGAAHGTPGFVVVGDNGTILASPDGTTWNARTAGTSLWLTAVTWGAGRFVAVGDRGTVLTSTDGITWRLEASGTTNRLNGIAHSAAGFLAVGEDGTVIHSNDGTTWSRRETGVSGWLRGVAFGRDRWVITGDGGTILTLPANGTTATPQLVATFSDLEAVLFDGTRFHAVGASFTHVVSTDATQWLRQTSGWGVNLAGITFRGVAVFDHEFLAAGDGGRVVDGSGANVTRGYETNWHVLAASPTTLVAAGTNGVIATRGTGSQAHSVSIRAFSLNAGGGVIPPQTYIGQYVTLEEMSYRNTPIAHRWEFNGEVIPEANGRHLVLGPLTPNHSGTFRLTTTYPGGVRATAQYRLDVQPTVPTSRHVDLTFNASLPKQPDAVAPLPDGRVYVAARDVFFDVDGERQHGLARLRADGTVDPTFRIGNAIGFEGTVSRITPLADGRVVVEGTFNSPGRATPPVLLRFHADGRLDDTLHPGPELLYAHRVLLADGRWLAVSMNGLEATVRRFTEAGASDATYAPVVLRTAAGTFDQYWRPKAVLFDRAANGRIDLVIGLYQFNWPYNNPHATWWNQFGADGTWHSHVERLVRNDVRLDWMDSTNQGPFLGTSFSYRAGRIDSTHSQSVWRFNRDDAAPGFGAVTWGYRHSSPPGVPYTEFGAALHAVAAEDSGALIAATSANQGRCGFVRFDATGQLDPRFSLELGASEVGLIATTHLLANGQLLVVGSFPSLNGVDRAFLARLTPDRDAQATRLVNLSIRTRAGSGDDTLIAGFTIAEGTKRVLARATGPALAPFGVRGTLANPRLTIFSGARSVLANEDWETAGSAAILDVGARVGAFPLSVGTRDAAAVAELTPGAYSMHVTGEPGQDGIALGEIYDGDTATPGTATSRLVNLSARARVGAGDGVLVAGFSIVGPGTRKLLVRGVGATLSGLGVTGALSNPVLTVFSGSQPVAVNDDRPIYLADSKPSEQAGNAVRAFPLASLLDATLLVNLGAGNYTVQVSGSGDATGIALVEVYEVP